jgi:hypothetical protein
MTTPPLGPPPTPYVPITGLPSPLRGLYTSLAEILRVRMTMAGGAPTITWTPISDVIDSFIQVPGQMMCRIELGFIRRGDAQPMALTAGRAPDRVGVMYCDLMPSLTGAPFILAGDRVHCISGPVFGTFEIRTIPDVAQDFTGPHHVEVQVVEVAESLAATSPTPFPGSEGPDT